MASNRGQDITTNFKVDISNLKKGISEANRQIKLANAEFKAASSGMDDWSKSTEGISAKIEQLTKKLEAEKSKLTAYQKQLELLNQKYEESKTEVDKLTQKHEEAARQYGETSSQAKKYAQQLDKAEAEVERNKIAIDNMTITMTNQQGTVNSVNREIGTFENTLNQLRTAENQAENSTDTMNNELNRSDEAARRAGDGFTVMKGALSNLLADGIRRAIQGLKDLASAAIDYESSFTGVKKTVNGTEEELAKLDKDIRKMAKSMPQSASSIADVAAAAGQLGIKTNDIADFTKTMIMLGDSTNLSSEEAASELAKFASVVGMSADDYSKLGSVIVDLGNNFATTEADIVNMGTRLASAGSQVGMSEANIMSLSAALSAVGLEAESGGTAFSKLLINMQVATEEGGKKLEDFAEVAGMSSKEFKKAFKEDATGALQAFIAGLADSEKSGKSAVGVLTDMGIKETRLRDSILRAVGAKDLFTDAIETGEKAWKEDIALTKEANQRYKTTASKIEIMKNNFMDIALTLFDKVQPALQKFIEGLTNLANNDKALKKIATTAKLLVGAFAVSKITKFTKVFASLITTVVGLGKGTLVVNALTGSIVANTTATTAGTAATRLFNAAWKANPIGLVVTGVGLLATGIYALVKATKKSNDETDKNIIANKKLKKEQDELNKSIKENTKARQDNLTSANEETGVHDVLMNKLLELNEVENKTNDQKATMKRLVSELNGIMPELNLQYNEEKDALNMSTEAIKANIAAQKELILAKAAEENLSKIAQDIAKQEIEQAKIKEQLTENEKAYKEARQATADFEMKHGKDKTTMTMDELKEYQELLMAENKKKEAYEQTNSLLGESKSKLKELNKEYNTTNEYANKMYSDAEIQKKIAALTDLAKAKGREIPEELANGMEEGMYAVPETLAQLDKLIAFDDAINKAGLAGVEIPLSISQGVISGKTSVQDAINQIKGVSNFDDLVLQAKESGVAIPKGLADNVTNGSLSVKDAVTLLNQSIDFTELVNKAGLEGSKLVENLSSQIRNGQLKPQEAIDEINTLTNYDKLVEKANTYGIKIPDTLEAGIKSGMLKPSQAVSVMNALISYQEALDKAGIEGAKVPKFFSEAIGSGKINVKNANAAINNLINFQKAIDKAGISGVAIPDTLSEKIANGKLTVEKATTQMNNWVQFQAALEASGLAGTKIPVKLQEGILSGKTKPKDAIKQLNKEAGEEANSPKSVKAMMDAGIGLGGKFSDGISSKKGDAKLAGENLIDGVNEGVSNPNKQSSVLNKVWSFGTNLLKKLKDSLVEKSPSKATNQMGQYLLEGLGLGIEKKENPVLKQISDFGKSVIDTLNDELSNNVDVIDVKTNLENSLNKAKATLSDISVPRLATATAGVGGMSNSSTTNSVVNNFNQVINAPKQPSRIDLYRQTKNLLSLKGGA